MSLWADAGSPGRFGAPRRGPRHVDAVERVKDWTRERFGLSADDTVMVSEGGPSFPGCPPFETLVAFWTQGGKPFHFKVFKPAEEVLEGDIPPAWMKDALGGIPGISCSCC